MAEFDVWLKTLPEWLQEARAILTQKKVLSEEDIGHLVKCCKRQAEHGQVSAQQPRAIERVLDEEIQTLRLNTISEISGINKLAPRKPLRFGAENLTIVYGCNGSGKSGYTRILKHVCGARHMEELLPNVFDEQQASSQGCKILYEIDGAGHEVHWTPALGSVEQLKTVDIFDSSATVVFLDKENAITYRPYQLQLIEELTNICSLVSSCLDHEISLLGSKKPILPVHLADAGPGRWYQELNAQVSLSEVGAKCEWTVEHQTEYDAMRRRLLEPDPLDRAKELSNQNAHLRGLMQKCEDAFTRLADDKIHRITSLNQALYAAEAAAQIAASQEPFESELPECGGEVWKQLWLHARKYSELAYPERDFPNISEGAVCVLCQQPLGERAQRRLENFEQFVSSSLEQKAKSARGELDAAKEQLPNIPSDELIQIDLDNSHVRDAALRHDCAAVFAALARRREEIAAGQLPSKPMPDVKALIGRLSALVAEREGQIRQFEAAANPEAREKLNQRCLELEVRHWLSQNKKAIEHELEILVARDKLTDAKRLTDTTRLSRKGGQLTASLVTQAFVDRFSYELNELGGRKIPVEVKQTRTARGQTLHQLALKGAKQQPRAVLSEGEQRVVALAAFLADVLGKEQSAPFIFDDPISSLDQDYEEATARRLADLASDRQVIVFTHRLSLVALLEDATEKTGASAYVIHLKDEPWGVGEPDYAFRQEPSKAINYMMNERLGEAERILLQEGRAKYEMHALALCASIRILLERIIEGKLLNGVVNRFRRAVTTKNQLAKLACISIDDCALFDQLMTKYSKYVHSQSDETPIPPPEPEEFGEDLVALQKWLAEWKARRP